MPNLPAPSPCRRLVEIPYYSLVRLSGESTTFWDGFEETSDIRDYPKAIAGALSLT
ncbi:hypothetical protein [Desulfatitalea tepidiphila]|uniref:hypothetical protein n=1 Tax=Desulfatitalea tepidiphila TaxID=1185843 RepID=UPI001910D566|nr:hypothetical protein [Desulfatitalea tepidiphila]